MKTVRQERYDEIQKAVHSLQVNDEGVIQGDTFRIIKVSGTQVTLKYLSGRDKDSEHTLSLKDFHERGGKVGKTAAEVQQEKPQLIDSIGEAAKKYGWTVKNTALNSFELFNRKENKTATILIKGNKYIIEDNGKRKLLSGNSLAIIGQGVEKVIKEYFYGSLV